MEQSVNEDSVQIGLSFDFKGHATFTKNIKIIPNAFSDHSALDLFLSPEEKKDQRGPGFWKCSNSLLTDKDYTELISKKITEFASKYHEVTDKGLLWEMIKVRAATILFSKRKAKENRDEERNLLEKFNRLQEKKSVHHLTKRKKLKYTV